MCSAVVVLRAAEAQPELKAAAFRANSQLVLVPVTVTDRNGKTVEGLRAADFHVFDDQRPQQIVSFANEDAPASIGIVLDISGSMRELLGSAKDITHAFLKTANTEDEFLLLTVSDLP
ncbi:MAG: VWA domain-containing protein, partial [Acidobacteriia bacterium]|nr:VWA domain-containing protein [Terriglobia bacterium]